MNLLNRLTIKNLRMNKKRTVVTIIGIMLATALITAVSGMAVSFQSSLVEYTKKNNGNYHYQFLDVPGSDLKYFQQNRSFEDYYLSKSLGYAYLTGSQNEDKPYLYVMALDKGGMENLALELLEGRLPENDNEILISKHIITNGRVSYQVGDTLTLDIGDRQTADGDPLSQETPYMEDEKLESLYRSEYQVVGIVSRPIYDMENYSAPGYTVITYLGEDQTAAGSETESYNIYVRYTDQALKNNEKITAEFLERESADAVYEYRSNKSLIQYQNLTFSDTVMTIIYGMVGIALLIIVTTSVFCIRNSFAISITEKMRQYGMLSSVGATPRQIQQNVYYEALLLAAVGIPAGILLGVSALWILVQIVGSLMVEAIEMELQFALSGSAILLAVLLSLITIFLSARRSGARAAKVSPIVAIRGNEDIKIGKRDVKAPRWIKKLFGMGGMVAYKNLRRNRRKYRTTVISIVVSVSIFIALSTFVEMIFDMAHFYYGDTTYNISFSTSSSSERYQEDYEVIKSVCQFDGINEATIRRNCSLFLDVDELNYTQKLKEVFPVAVEPGMAYLDVWSVGEQEYEAYLKKLGLSYEEAKDKAILIGKYNGTFFNEDGSEIYVTVDMFDMKAGEIITGEMEKCSVSFELAAVTDERPLGLEEANNGGFLIVSDAWMDAHTEYAEPYFRVFIDCEDADKLQQEIEADDNWIGSYVENMDAEYRRMSALYTIIAIFLYGFITVISLIGITNIFNTITTNMELRSAEFAMLRSVGMTKREFDRMIRLESVFYGTKSLLIGVPIGIALSYAFNYALQRGVVTDMIFPWFGVTVSVLAVFLLLLCIMRYSLNRINRQNIIETIRKENI